MKIAIYTWAGMGNLGDDWLLDLVLAAVRARGIEAGVVLEPQAEVPAVAQGSPVVRWPRRRELPEVARFRKEMRAYDRLVLGGGGWFAGDRGIRPTALWLQRLALLPVPVSSLGLGVGRFTSRAAARVGRATVRLVNHSGVWDVRTAADGQQLSQLGVSDHRVSSDIALAAWNPDALDQVGTRRGVLVSLPAPQGHWLHGQAGAWATGIQRRVLELAGGESVTFVPFQNSTVSDSDFWSSYFSRVEEVQQAQEFTRMAGAARVVVAGRLHAALAAAVVVPPELAVLGYHHKFDVVRRLGVEVTDVMSGELLPGSPRRDLLDAEKRAITSSIMEVLGS